MALIAPSTLVMENMVRRSANVPEGRYEGTKFWVTEKKTLETLTKFAVFIRFSNQSCQGRRNRILSSSQPFSSR